MNTFVCLLKFSSCNCYLASSCPRSLLAPPVTMITLLVSIASEYYSTFQQIQATEESFQRLRKELLSYTILNL